MRKTLVAALLGALVSPVALAAAPSPSPAPGRTPPPEIYHLVVHPVCSALQTKIKPAVGMLLQNDRLIAKSPAMFKEYTTGRFNDSQPQQDMALHHMSDLVGPLADNVLAIQKLLEDQSIFPPVVQTEDDKRALDMRNKLLQALAEQQASLDIINGFVETQNLADMQHQGFGYIQSITDPGQGPNSKGPQMPNGLTQMIGPSADPLRPATFDNTAINAGLAPNPYEVDLARLPGLAMGFNPISALQKGLEYTQKESGKREEVAARSVVDTVKMCGGQEPNAAPTSRP